MLRNFSHTIFWKCSRSALGYAVPHAPSCSGPFALQSHLIELPRIFYWNVQKSHVQGYKSTGKTHLYALQNELPLDTFEQSKINTPYATLHVV